MAKIRESLFSFILPGKKEEEDEEKKKEKEKIEAEKRNPLIQGKTISLKNGEKRYNLIMESTVSGIERFYFWILRFIKQEPNFGLGFDTVEKIYDVFDASVTSSFHGHIGAKLAAIQQQASQYLATIGQMVKTIFPIVRELRIIDERLEYYDKSAKGDESAEIALKSIWIELVERGVENPNSVYGLATKVGFLTLPDLFFKINPKNGAAGIKEAVESMKKEGINKKVRDVVQKKLFQYYTWKERTEKELRFRRNFTIKYLRQHYNAIKLYMDWVRPYLKTIKQLQVQGKISDADLVSAFETAKVQIELLARKTSGFKKYFPCILVKFNYVTIPELVYTPTGQKQPIHMGRTEIVIEPYVATKEEIETYKRKKEEEDIELLSSINEAMMALKDDLKKYLEEAGEKFEVEKKKEEKPSISIAGTIFEPFFAIFSAFRDLFSFLIPTFKRAKGEKTEFKSPREFKEEREKAISVARNSAWTLYHIFKKAHKLMAP